MANMAMMKAVLVLTGVVSVAVMLKLSLLSFSWFKPPYLYLIINCIILSIVASSKLQPRGAEVSEKVDIVGKVAVKSAAAEEERERCEDDVPAVEEVVFGYVDESDLVENDARVPEEEVLVVAESGGGDVEETESITAGGGSGVKEEFTVLKSMWTLPEDITAAKTVDSVEKPPVSARFAHRRAIKSSPEGKAVLKKVSRPKKQETLESTWRTLTEGRPMPLTRHLRKSDTFTGTQDASPPVRVIKKSGTFSGHTTASPGSGGRLRREASMSQDELNRRVEAFIKKFNEEMRLQRQESLHQYKEMMARA